MSHVLYHILHITYYRRIEILFESPSAEQVDGH